MALYLEPKEKDLLKPILKSMVETKTGEYWIAESILKKIYSDEQRLEEMKNCKHEYGEYKGKKECCTKCHNLDIGMGESWELIDNVR